MNRLAFAPQPRDAYPSNWSSGAHLHLIAAANFVDQIQQSSQRVIDVLEHERPERRLGMSINLIGICEPRCAEHLFRRVVLTDDQQIMSPVRLTTAPRSTCVIGGLSTLLLKI